MTWTLIYTDAEDNEWHVCRPPNDYPYIRIIYKEHISVERLLELKKQMVILKENEVYKNIYDFVPGYLYLMRYTQAYLYNDAGIVEYRVTVKNEMATKT